MHDVRVKYDVTKLNSRSFDYSLANTKKPKILAAKVGKISSTKS